MISSREELIQSLIDDGYLKTPEIIAAFRAIDRLDFVRPENQDEAYANYPLPIGEGQTISQPLTVAFMLELLEPRPGERILDIGSGSGWQTALLAYIVERQETEQQRQGTSDKRQGKVDAVEVIPELCQFGEENVKKYNFVEKGIVKFYCQDGSQELPEGLYDKIIAAAASSGDMPKIWRERLKIGGRIVAPVDGSIKVYRRLSESEWEEEEYKGYTFVPLMRGEGEAKRVEGKNASRTFGFWLLAFGLLVAGIFAYEVYFPHTSFPAKKEIIITPGLGSRKIGEVLKREGVIRSKWVFVTYATLKGLASSLKPGVYTFFQNATIPVAMHDLVAGANNERIITIPESWNNKDLAVYLEREGIMNRDAFFGLAGQEEVRDWESRFEFLSDKPPQAGLEGYLFPDTYRVSITTPPEDFIKKILANFDRKLAPELRTEIAGQGKTIFEIVVMASMIEKEVASDEDRAIVSGILWKRLKLGIPLQVDATIIYLTGKKSTQISREETRIDSPYNTYKYRGLPQGPIANPGLSAILAAIYPEQSPHLYYLSASDGATVFSRTLEEHLAAKRKYLD